MKKALFVLLLLALSVVASYAILNGTVESGYQFVGGLFHGETFLGSGVLIDNSWVLTSAHTVADPQPDTFRVGGDLAAPTQVFSVSQSIPHSSFDPGTGAFDIAMVRLSEPVSGFTLLPYNTNSLNAHAGSSFSVIGYGVSMAGVDSTAGTRRSTATWIETVSMNTFTSDYAATGSGPCTGDSGGPAVMNIAGADRVIGIVSAGEENCVGYTTYSRVDYYAGFIEAAMASEAPNAPPAAPTLLHPQEDQVVSGASVLFAWTPASDPEGGAVTYKLHVTSTGSFGTGIDVVAWPAAGSVWIAASMLILAAATPSAGNGNGNGHGHGRRSRNRNRNRKLMKLALVVFISLMFVSCPGTGADPDPDDLIIDLPNDAVTYEYDGLEPASTYLWKIVVADSDGAETESVTGTFTTE